MKFLLIFVWLFFLFCSSGADNKTYKRSTPPKKWDILTQSIFNENAFDTLEGQRPDFNNVYSKSNTINTETLSDKKEHEISKDDFDMSNMMSKLETCEDSLRECLQTEDIFITSTKQIETYSDIIIMIGRTLSNSNPVYDDPDSFLKYAQNMKDNAQALKVFVRQKKYKEAYEYFNRIQKNCNDCHTQYRL